MRMSFILLMNPGPTSGLSLDLSQLYDQTAATFWHFVSKRCVHVFQSAPVEASAETTNGAETSSCDPEEADEATVSSSGPVEPGRAASDQTEDQSSREEPEELMDDELQQVCDPRLNLNYVVVQVPSSH